MNAAATMSMRVPFVRLPLRLAALRLLFPSMLLNIVVSNQLWNVGGVNPGQVIFWWVLILVTTVLVGSFRHSIWAWALAGAIVGARALEAVTGLSAPYFVAVNAAFLCAGIIAALEAPGLVFRQVRFFLLLCLPLMFLQVVGAGEWTQALNTEYWVNEQDFGNRKVIHPMLFQPLEFVQYNYGVGQGRPAGLLHANNVLSLIIIFGFVLQFGRVQRPRVTWTDAVLVGVTVLAMAKIVLLTVLLLMLWMWLLRDSVCRARATGVAFLFVIGYGIYALLFPGLFEMQLSGYKIMYSISVRVFDVLESFTGLSDSQRSTLLDMMGEARTYHYASDEDVGKLSGYALILEYWPVLVGGVLAMTPVFFLGLARLRARASTAAATAFAAALTVVLYPAAVPFFRAQMYWFVFGFAAVAFVILLAPRFANELIERGRREGLGAP
jgi:hypothetical protein